MPLDYIKEIKKADWWTAFWIGFITGSAITGGGILFIGTLLSGYFD